MSFFFCFSLGSCSLGKPLKEEPGIPYNERDLVTSKSLKSLETVLTAENKHYASSWSQRLMSMPWTQKL